MTVRAAINGFGRIGRLVLRAIAETGRRDVTVVAINDLAPPATNAHLFRYDSVHGRFPGKVTLEGDVMDVGTGPIKVLNERDIAKLPWGDLGVDVVMECTGVFTSKDKASAHLAAGAKKVLISAPADGADVTVVFGVNQHMLRPEHKVVSNASCTTNCLAPLAKVLHEGIGIRRGHMTTVHAFTNDQNLLDVFHKDLYRARAATSSIIPTSTGAARAVGLVLPELKGKLDGVAMRVPTQNVSLVDLTFVPERKTTVEEVNTLLEEAARGALAGILAVTREPLVSIDFNHCPASSTVDLNATKVIEGELVRVAAWYDNEWGFSNRMVDVAALLGSL
ncbi:MAG: type I glyceraldehyde-3-phosphate dehydrogenase [Geminicoccaceae bacterium]|nr:type I glyceraldehyde-3-phosphate dehydrogenase [Geminicoccaceae bacterium]MCS7267907.1 type I glyceraldehyde-3-phosphate dehydrogenase [Geminicoccaceae bacterium]MDW8124463.1 type I glyceraldehyde-3-phosphate dehydrogenase [Geminicoccaceae bacterium]MDW8342494.1 type I glyceraldehyde-3-phosphate dehydrogenase [Geminicoccaceae bacterium]